MLLTNVKDMERRLKMSNNLNELEMAKKRDHKIMITYETIRDRFKFCVNVKNRYKICE